MAKVASWSQEGPTDPAHTTILHSTEDEKNVSQIGILLEVRNESSRFLMSNPSIGTVVEMDPEAVKDARETYTLAGLQLRNLLDANERWTLVKNDIDVKTAAVLDLKIVEHNTRIAREKALQTPTAIYRPSIRKLELSPGALKWVCWLGTNEPTHFDVHGIGDTAAEAAAAFDSAFVHALATPPPVQQQPAAPAAPTQALRKPRKTKGNK
jgi:hypothetical protein